jgi:preprotein translocase subunit SecF
MDFRGRNIDLVGKYWLWFGLSAFVLAVGFTSWIAFGLNLGLDFKGGGQLQYRIPYSQRPKAGEEVTLLNKARAQLEASGLKNARLQIAGGNTLVILTDAVSNEQLARQRTIVSESLAPQLKGTDQQGRPQELGTPLSEELVGPVIGQELRNNAIYGVLFGVLLIAAWIYIRYNFAGNGLRYAVAGILALVHDVFVLIGLFALIGKIDPRIEIDGSFIAALLTVVGYSINDSVVIFVRIRENLNNYRKTPPNEIINASLLETMSRSINTGLTVVIMLLALLFFGGESIYNFVLAMVIGVVAGLYSSVFNASMVLVAWNHYDERKAEAARQARAGRRAGRDITVRDVTQRPAITPQTRPLPVPTPVPKSDGNEAGESSSMDASTTETEPVSTEQSSNAATRRSPTKARARRRY